MLGAALFVACGTANVYAQDTPAPSEEEVTSIGGYGEVHYTEPEGTPKGTVDVARFIIFLEHGFSPDLSFFSELEVEHTKLEGGEEGGEVALEQAYLQYTLSERIGVRAGLMVLPIGIVNEFHEPPTFNGVRRPRFDHDIIPTTWREIGVGIVGRVPEVEGLQYRAYLTSGLNAEGFSHEEAIRGGRFEGAEAEMSSLALSARVEYVNSGLRTGGWIYFGGSAAGNTDIAKGLFGAPVTMFGLDAQYSIANIYLRGIFAHGLITDAHRINVAYHNGPDATEPIGSAFGGGYAEVAYDVAKLISPNTTQQLLPFVRFEKFNTQADVPAGVTALATNDRTFITAGLTYKPTYNTAFKLDYTMADDATSAKVPGEFALGVGYNF